MRFARHINRGKFATGSSSMMDIAVLAIGSAFFAVSIAYVYACDVL
jgi:hypothetical protein